MIHMPFSQINVILVWLNSLEFLVLKMKKNLSHIFKSIMMLQIRIVQNLFLILGIPALSILYVSCHMIMNAFLKSALLSKKNNKKWLLRAAFYFFSPLCTLFYSEIPPLYARQIGRQQVARNRVIFPPTLPPISVPSFYFVSSLLLSTRLFHRPHLFSLFFVHSVATCYHHHITNIFITIIRSKELHYSPFLLLFLNTIVCILYMLEHRLTQRKEKKKKNIIYG
mmetsp:Transcript_10635/g.14716  ORF Transcript_10635/g.14716 Transcript_10635/m.14716 type:complete len:224 (+) Transcript_10635:4120-4791(+)